MNIRPNLPMAYATASAMLLAMSITSPSAAQTALPEAYLVQMVCVDGADVAIFGDPALCPSSRRKLRIGEALPYHKVDTGGYQISASFPIASADGSTKGVQTYFFTEDLNKDPLFPRPAVPVPAARGIQHPSRGQWLGLLSGDLRP